MLQIMGPLAGIVLQTEGTPVRVFGVAAMGLVEMSSVISLHLLSRKQVWSGA